MDESICISLKKFHIVTDSSDPTCLVEKGSCIVNLVLGIIIIGLNGVVMKRFLSRSSIQKNIGNMLFMQQAVVDSLNAGYALVNSVETVSPCLVRLIDSENKLRLRHVSIFLFNCSAFASVFTLSLISLERLLSVWKPVLHRNKVQQNCIKRLIALLWIVSLVMSLLYIAISTVARNGTLSCKDYRIIGEFYYWVYFIFAVSIAPIFLGTFLVAKNAVKRLERNGNVDLQRKTKNEFKLIKIFSMIYFGFLLSTLPILCIRYVNGIPPTSAAAGHHIWRVMLILTSIFNPLLTLSSREDFKRKTFRSNNLYELK